ncbi:AmmeMemoRadiSam system protein B [Patescibacteria group bacterium]|nr:AmmeMemoRadiSam system protein B [Patescibacteria group bacterium]MBU1448893.1 AmmeMemoRadiSam system protein B [Patescibacteria group bacterium]MBU2613301.1 AmmeMemoRadiSam system protein B [Patescibacteria group bacterium]
MTRRVFSSGIITAAIAAAVFGYVILTGLPRTSSSEGGDSSVIPLFTKGELMEIPVVHREIDIPINADTFIDPARPDAVATTGTPFVGTPIAGVVNHHTLASDLIDRFFRTLRASRPVVRRFVIIAPDHFRAGTDAVTVGNVAYFSRGTVIRSDADAVAALVSDRRASMGEREIFEQEHGVAALIPSLARTYPDATILPVLVRGDVPRERMDALGASLADFIADGRTFILISSDMSHELTEAEALRNDAETGRHLASLDRAWFASVGDDHTDSGPAFVALTAMFGATETTPMFGVVDHSVSSRYNGDRNYVTSYLTGLWSISL